ncbi:MAG: tRNA 2-thiouridine(34) synthase MnmA [Alphaproteobacteria bacterium]
MNLKEKNRICVAMSGGVDSSAAALILKKQGYDVLGLTMNLLGEELVDAKRVADKIGIEHHFIDFQKEFNNLVIDYFKKTYLSGATPSPCLMCNKYIKLGFLVEKAKELGANGIVTGHYAKIKDGSLYVADDLNKDQSYFLCLVKKENLEFLSLPLYGMTKDETRQLLKDEGIEIYNKPDSQDICFIKDGKYAELFGPQPEGNIVDVKGNILGKHKGIINHTIGQRRGLGIGGFVNPLYVVKIDAEKNEVVLGEEECLKTLELFVSDINLLESVENIFECEVKLRSKQKNQKAKVELLENNCAKIILQEPAYGVAKGQICCFYGENSIVLGGGIIS